MRVFPLDRGRDGTTPAPGIPAEPEEKPPGPPWVTCENESSPGLVGGARPLYAEQPPP